jgi:hypothetical protein
MTDGIVDKALSFLPVPKAARKRRPAEASLASRKKQLAALQKSLIKLTKDVAALAKSIAAEGKSTKSSAKRMSKKRPARKLAAKRK